VIWDAPLLRPLAKETAFVIHAFRNSSQNPVKNLKRREIGCLVENMERHGASTTDLRIPHRAVKHETQHEDDH